MVGRVLVAGATGAIGTRLLPLLRAAGYAVVGATRSEDKARGLRGLGYEAVVADVYDVPALSRVLADCRPDVVIHQLTDLPKNLDSAQMRAGIVRNARIRNEGTGNLVRAAVASGVRRMVAQSIAWAYAPGPGPHSETDPLETEAAGDRAISVGGVIALEDWVLRTSNLQGVALRYGHIFGPGTHSSEPSDFAPVHVDAAAHAALLAIEHGAPGAYNIAQPNRHVATDKALRELGWSPDFRLP